MSVINIDEGITDGFVPPQKSVGNSDNNMHVSFNETS